MAGIDRSSDASPVRSQRFILRTLADGAAVSCDMSVRFDIGVVALLEENR